MSQQVRPVSYRLEFEPDLDRATFSGTAEIEAVCGRPTSSITMDAAELKIRSCMAGPAGKAVRARARLDAKSEKLHITAGKRLAGKITIKIEFEGSLNDRLLGFYRSAYRRGSKTKYWATTQFEAADARRAFPCWDEPAAKATFEISLVTAGRNGAISNMPAVSKEKAGRGRIRHRFAPTPVMSTYLVYLGVGEFEFLTGRQDGVAIRVVAVPGNKRRCSYALGLAKKLLKAYGDYFGIKYPLPKLDLIAVPDFAAGAMENWGAITFREAILLYDPATSSTRTKQFIAEVISHEIAHQWFGNLVTMEWWNDLWLNESFATYMATKFVDKFYPKWDMWGQFVGDAMSAAMSLDSLASTHPIDVPVRSPSEIREIFDAISYDKGGCVLRMLEDYVGEPRFRAGLRAYLKKHKYANARGQHLWAEIGRASKMPVPRMVSSWIGQPGFPLVSASKKGRRIALSQSRFMLDGSSRPGKWVIPVSAASGSKRSKAVVSARTGSISLPRGQHYVVNESRRGFYRVAYDEAALIDLKYAVQTGRLGRTDRWAAENDLFALCMSGRVRLSDYLDFADAYAGERDYLAASGAGSNLMSAYRLLRGRPGGDAVYGCALEFFLRLHRGLGWEAARSEPHTDALLRSQAVSSLGRLQYKPVIEEGAKRFSRFVRRPSSLAPDLREPVFSLYAAHENGASAHRRLAEMYKKAPSQEEKQRYLSAMCAFEDPKLLKRTLDFSLTGAVRSQNMHLPVLRTAANPSGRAVMWPWLSRNWGSLSSKVGRGNPLLARIISSVPLAAEEADIPRVRAFFARRRTPGTERAVSQAIERMRIGGAFVRRAAREYKSQ